MSIDLTNKTALITGASRGIGEAAAQAPWPNLGPTSCYFARSSGDIERIAA